MATTNIPLRIIAGTKNPAKLTAIREVLALYPFLKHELIPLEVESSVPSQPIGLEQIQEGAQNRAHQARTQGLGDIGIGIESGLMKVNGILYDIGICVIDDGRKIHCGTTPAFVVPAAIASFIEQGNELSDACRLVGFTSEVKIGANQGLIHLLTNGRMNRSEFTKPAVLMAMCSLELPENYK
jgi:inosine/xanthosine triphosphatase